MELLCSNAWLAFVTWLILRAIRQRDALEQVAPLAGPLNRTAPTVAIVVPARDEAANIRVCVSSLIAQTYPMHLLQIVVVDDHSRDETASIVATLARKYSSLVLLHLAVRSEICEDVALARRANRSGLRVALAGGDRLLLARIYPGWQTLWLGVSKNLVDMMGGPVSAG